MKPYMEIFTVSLFTITKNWKELKMFINWRISK